MDLSNIVMQGEIQALQSRLFAFQKMDQNPLKAEIKKFENALAYKVVNIPGPAFNTVRNLNDKNCPHLKEITSWYEQSSTSFHIEIPPQNASEDLFMVLQQQGFYQTGFHASFIGQTEKVLASNLNKSIQIDLLEKDDFDAFASVYVKGFGLPDFIKDGVKQNNVILYDVEGWNFFKVTVENKIVGIAVLYIENEIATLAAATTLPEYRGLGIQKSLIHTRAEYAKHAGAKFVTSEAKFGSISHLNMVKCGMQLAYTKALYGKIK